MSLLLLLFFLISINGFSLVPAFYHDPSSTMRFELIHRHAPELSGKTLGAPKTWLERVNELAHSDKLRIQMISQRVDQRRRTAEVPGQSSFGIPMTSGSYAGTGQYFVSFRVGTPAQKFLLVADTGSDLTWMNCNFPCHRCPRRVRRRRIFHPEHSFSFKTIPCASQMCRFDLQNLFSLTLCPTPVAPCAYDFGYKDGSSAQGFFANESVTVGLMNGRKMKLHNMLLGCSKTFQGGSFRTADGVLGLGFSKYSFAVRATQSFGGKFSYCLVDHLSPRNISNYLTFGNSHAALPDMQYTQLFTGVIDSFYGVNVGGISVGGVMLRIPMYIWDVFGQGGMIVDSGSTLTYLPELAFRPLMDALKLPLLRLEKVKIDIFEFCFNSTTGFDEAMVPRLAIHFADGARLEPPVKSYVIKVADGVRCLGFQTIQWPATSILGSIMQQNHLWEFDLLRNRLGFVPSTCVHS